MNKYINKSNILIFFYCLITFSLIQFHEIWRDEAQKWLIARDNDLIGVFNAAAYEGHPCLWTLLIFPIVKFGFPVIYMQYLNWLIMCLSVVVFVKKAPFKFVLKFLFVFSYFMMFEYGIIARNYCLVIFFLFLIAHNHSLRREKPYYTGFLLFILLQTHILMVGFVAAYALIYLLEAKEYKINRQNAILLLIVITGFVFLFFQLKSPADSTLSGNSAYSIIYTIQKHQGIFSEFFASLFSVANFIPINAFFSIVLLIVILNLFRVSNSNIFIYVAGISIFMLLNIFYTLNVWHTALLFVLLIVVIWMNYSEVSYASHVYSKKLINGHVILCILLAPSVFYNLRFYENDFKMSYSNAKPIAEKINEKYNLQTIKLVGAQSYCLAGVLVYLNKKDLKFYCSGTETWISYTKWVFSVFRNYPIREKTFIERTRSKFGSDTNVVCVVEKQFFDLKKAGNKIYDLDSITTKPFNKTDEDFYIFKIRN